MPRIVQYLRYLAPIPFSGCEVFTLFHQMTGRTTKNPPDFADCAASSTLVTSDKAIYSQAYFAPMPVGSDSKNLKPPTCPSCGSSKVIQTFEHFGECIYFCSHCETSWSTRDGAWSRQASNARP